MIIASHKNTPLAKRRAKDLRKQFSFYENRLWNKLRQIHKIEGLKFRRQQPLSPYIADFACMEAKLVIELDGDSHDRNQVYDQKRDAYLRRCGYEVLRFHNNEIISDMDSVVMTIVGLAIKRMKDPSPAKTKGLLTQTQVFATSPARGEE